MYAYLFTHNQILQTNDLTQFFEETDAIEHWVKCLPMAYILVSREPAAQLSNRVRAAFGNDLRFIILDTDTDRSGWLSKNVWEIIRNPDDYSNENRYATLMRRLQKAAARRKK